MVGRPLIHEAPIAVRVAQEDPARPASERLPRADKLGPPPLDTPEVALQRLVDGPSGNAVTAEAVEVQLVQDHRIGGDQLLPLQAVDREYGRLDEVELRELCRDSVQPPYGSALIVLPVAEDQLLRESLQSRRVTGQWLHCARHRSSPCYRPSSAGCLSSRLVTSDLPSSRSRRPIPCVRSEPWFSSPRSAASSALLRALASRSRIRTSTK